MSTVLRGTLLAAVLLLASSAGKATCKQLPCKPLLWVFTTWCNSPFRQNWKLSEMHCAPSLGLHFSLAFLGLQHSRDATERRTLTTKRLW